MSPRTYPYKACGEESGSDRFFRRDRPMDQKSPIRLLTIAEAPRESEAVTRFGGHPLFPAAGGLSWPQCAACGGAMQFLGQLRVPARQAGPDRLLLLFMRQNQEGVCGEWDADSGANRV